VLPAKLAPRFRWVAYQIVHFRRAEVPRIHFDQDSPGARLDAALGLSLSLPLNLPAGVGKGLFYELSHRMGLTCRENIVIWLGLLKDKPHAFDIIACVPPVALGIEISKIKLCLMTVFDCTRLRE
jgi:hypothetical protein